MAITHAKQNHKLLEKPNKVAHCYRTSDINRLIIEIAIGVTYLHINYTNIDVVAVLLSLCSFQLEQQCTIVYGSFWSFAKM